MQLSDLRQEVLNHGFDPIYFAPARLNQYINDGYFLTCRRTQFYTEEGSFAINTVSGTASYAWPTNFARLRSLYDSSRYRELQAVGLRDIDRSSPTNGAPSYYAIDGANVHLFPTPDGIYPLIMRYWKTPATLVNDSDAPILPVDWHHLLWVYATWLCYEAEDDAQMGAYWQKRYMTELAEFQADQKFPNSDFPTQAKGMWDSESGISSLGWTLWGAGY